MSVKPICIGGANSVPGSSRYKFHRWMATSRNDIASDTTAIISLACEWGLYGVSVLLYGATVRRLAYSPVPKVGRRMIALATAFFALSTAVSHSLYVTAI
ncbi:hypothetical protein K435DRAFT_881641 [Dendrothele bispora CBS 962.96]|uniref:Uncharacterized protein n=1 Tax=Dendrothele bispora (strain CBS 962.96) TaxID=1314807 RepID=A0A4S8KI74_DENBC|nr:hypothetical protein K435DRAFT_881641 [Dendrothele bispora CBS 962.96]